MITLEDIHQKLCNIEIRLKATEKHIRMGNYSQTLLILEDIAEKCPEFQGFNMSTADSSYASCLQVQCTCQKPEHTIAFEKEGIKDIFFFKQCIEEINQKFKKPPIPKPEIYNATTGIKLQE